MSVWSGILRVGVGLALLVAGARWLVEGAVTFARVLGVSELVIGLTVVAAGTSLPEVAASIAASLRGQRDIAVGNVIGSTFVLKSLERIGDHATNIAEHVIYLIRGKDVRHLGSSEEIERALSARDA